MTRAGTRAIEAFFAFETRDGRGSGIVRLAPDAADGNALKAWTLLTALDELKGHEERTGAHRPTGQSHSRDFRGPNWLDQRNAAAAYDGPRSGRAGGRRRTGGLVDRGAARRSSGSTR